MKNSKRKLLSLLVAAGLTMAPLASHAEVLFKDGFESGSLSATLKSLLSGTTAYWNDRAYVDVSSNVAKTGSKAAKFWYSPSNTWSELRFDLGKVVNEVWMQYDLYIPANYYHSAYNNKFFRLWGSTYDDYEKVGSSTWANGSGYSTLIGDWNSTGGGVGPSGQESPNFISSADKGQWMNIKIYVKAPTATTKGTMKLWKNGVLKLDDTNLVNNYKTGEAHGYRYGYLLGWANSGYATTTEFYIDNAVFATTEADLGGTTSTTTSPPAAPVLNVK